MADAGHVIGNHTYNHPIIGGLTDKQIATEIDSCGDKILKLTGSQAIFFRPPRGELNDKLLSAATSEATP